MYSVWKTWKGWNFLEVLLSEMKDTGYRLAVFDMDGVLTQNPSSWGFVHGKLGVDNTRNLNLYRNGELTYMEFLKSDVNLWLDKMGRISSGTVIGILDEVPLREGIRETVSALKSMGIRTAIVSGGIYWLAERVGKVAEFDMILANKIKTDDSGFIIPDGHVLVDPKHKDRNIKELQAEFGVKPEETISVGDTLQDVAMFRNSGLSVAFNPVDPEMKERATFSTSGNNISVILEYIEKIR